jgi:hypothetical protein
VSFAFSRKRLVLLVPYEFQSQPARMFPALDLVCGLRTSRNFPLRDTVIRFAERGLVDVEDLSDSVPLFRARTVRACVKLVINRNVAFV